MHYEGWAFAKVGFVAFSTPVKVLTPKALQFELIAMLCENRFKQEALDAGEFAMTNKATGEGVVVDAPFLSSIDAVQLAKRYRAFCSVPETRTCPGSPDDYYLKGQASTRLPVSSR